MCLTDSVQTMNRVGRFYRLDRCFANIGMLFSSLVFLTEAIWIYARNSFLSDFVQHLSLRFDFRTYHGGVWERVDVSQTPLLPVELWPLRHPDPRGGDCSVHGQGCGSDKCLGQKGERLHCAGASQRKPVLTAWHRYTRRLNRVVYNKKNCIPFIIFFIEYECRFFATLIYTGSVNVR